MKSLPLSAFVALCHIEYDAFVVLVSLQPNPSDFYFAIMVMALLCFFSENSSNITIAVFAQFPSFSKSEANTGSCCCPSIMFLDFFKL